MSIQHKDIPEAQLHEVKGASTSTTGQVLVSTGGAAAFATPAIPSGAVIQGFWDYHDLGTTGSPIPLTVAGTKYELSNDGAGVQTQLAFSLTGLDNIWDVGTDRFVWSNGNELLLGDTVDVRFDVEYTTSLNNTDISLFIEMGIGGPFPFTLPIIIDKDHASGGTFDEVHNLSFYMGSSATLDFPARVVASASKTGVTVVVNGWYIRAFHAVT